MFLSVSEIDAQAQKLVTFELQGKPLGHVEYARQILSPRDQAVDIAVHERTAELYEELIAAAPGIWNGRDQGIADAEAAMGGADDAR